ncbi:MAG: hypothetical protein ACREBU_00020 [Nitrososphaera sp.]
MCGEHPRFTQGIQQINPYKLWDMHHECMDKYGDPVCQPDGRAFLMWVGNEYTVNSFIVEAQIMGVSKRIPAIPANMDVGRDWVFLAKLHLIPLHEKSFSFNGDEERGYAPGVFYAFQPERIELILPDDQNTAQLQEELTAKGITPVIVPSNDPDHRRRRKSNGTKSQGRLADD